MDQGAGLPGTGKPLSHVCMVSHFTCKMYMSVNFNDTLGPTSAHRVVTVRQLCCQTLLVRERQMFGCRRLLASGKKRSSALNSISSRLSGTSLVIFLHRVKSELRPLTFTVASLASLSKHTTMHFFSFRSISRCSSGFTPGKRWQSWQRLGCRLTEAKRPSLIETTPAVILGLVSPLIASPCV